MKIKVLNFFMASILVLSFQNTVTTIAGIKIGEILSFILGVIFFLLNSKINKVILYYSILFLFILVLTFFININTNFFIPDVDLGFFKRPYIFSFVRFIEVFSCFLMIHGVVSYSKIFLKDNYFNIKSFVNIFLFLNVLFSLFLFFMYFIHINNIYFSDIVYDNNRLKGFYIEGGPLGLYYASLFIITWLLNRNYFYLLVFFMVIFLASSKAGIVYLLFFYFFYFIFFKINNGFIRILSLVSILILFPIFFYMIAGNYLDDIINYQELLKTRENDTNFIMGRISGFFIGSEMVINNPILGVGLGNYSFVRNDPNYLGSFPSVNEWDLTGLGIFTLLIESGLLGFGGFSLLAFYLYKEVTRTDIEKLLLVNFYFTFFFGVQIYFQYPWISLGILLAINRGIRYENCNRF